MISAHEPRLSPDDLRHLQWDAHSDGFQDVPAWIENVRCRSKVTADLGFVPLVVLFERSRLRK